MKYIDAESLRATIEKRINSIESCPCIEAELGSGVKRAGKILAYNEILALIDSLQREQPEYSSSLVDFESISADIKLRTCDKLEMEKLYGEEY